MKARYKYLLILLLPFVVMIIINESCRPFLNGKPHVYLGALAMNSAEVDLDKCSWVCHNFTASHCIKHHRKMIKSGFPFYKELNIFYEGIINFNSRKKNGQKVSDPKFYSAMNLIFLVLLWPLIIFLLLINFLRLRKKSKAMSL